MSSPPSASVQIIGLWALGQLTVSRIQQPGLLIRHDQSRHQQTDLPPLCSFPLSWPHSSPPCTVFLRDFWPSWDRQKLTGSPSPLFILYAEANSQVGNHMKVAPSLNFCPQLCSRPAYHLLQKLPHKFQKFNGQARSWSSRSKR